VRTLIHRIDDHDGHQCEKQRFKELTPISPSPTPRSSNLTLQTGVFALVAASFLNIYITQPVLPILMREFSTDMVTVSLSVSAVILGMALSNLPFGLLADKWPIRPIILAGGLVVTLAGLACAATHTLWVLIAARFLQGIFIPAATTCLVAHLSRTLPLERLNVVMGAYVSATVLGGLGGRLLGGWIHPPLDWRYALVSAAALTFTATLMTLWAIPRSAAPAALAQSTATFRTLIKRWELLRIYICAAGSLAIFSSVFNYLPFRMAEAPFYFSTEQTTMLYLVYVMGIFMGPMAGRAGNRYGTGNTMIAGALILGLSLALVRMPSVTAVVTGLLGTCAGFFAIHASAVGALNRKLSGGQGRANALYVLFYYVGGWMGITAAGFAYKQGGWAAVVWMGWLLLIVPIAAGVAEIIATQTPTKERT
jgi:MFS transporter, YNFM family, putative membrane transport protein